MRDAARALARARPSARLAVSVALLALARVVGVEAGPAADRARTALEEGQWVPPVQVGCRPDGVARGTVCGVGPVARRASAIARLAHTRLVLEQSRGARVEAAAAVQQRQWLGARGTNRRGCGGARCALSSAALPAANAVTGLAVRRRLVACIAHAHGGAGVVLARAMGATHDFVARLLCDDLDVRLHRAGDDPGHLHAVRGDTEEGGEVAHQVLRIEELLDGHLVRARVRIN